VFSYLYFLNNAAFTLVCQNLITAAEQIFLFGAIVYFRVRDGPFKEEAVVLAAAIDDERKALLVNEE
jgi:hypothetical protein